MLLFDPDSLASDARRFIGCPPADATADPVLTLQTFATEEALALTAHRGGQGPGQPLRSGDHILPTGGCKSSPLGKNLRREGHPANRRSKSVLIAIGGAAA
jgi:hypothetical protein